MDQGLIPRRYAKALYEFALGQKADKRIYDLMKRLSLSFAQQPQIDRIMANPYVAVKDKTDLLATAAEADQKADSCFFDFIKLLVKNRRINDVRSIALAYLDIYRTANRIYPVTVTSAIPLDEEAQQKLHSIITNHLGDATAEFTTHTDPALIGGFVVTINSERLDASLSNQLKQLRLNLLSN